MVSETKFYGWMAVISLACLLSNICGIWSYEENKHQHIAMVDILKAQCEINKHLNARIKCLELGGVAENLPEKQK